MYNVEGLSLEGGSETKYVKRLGGLGSLHVRLQLSVIPMCNTFLWETQRKRTFSHTNLFRGTFALLTLDIYQPPLAMSDEGFLRFNKGYPP